jgi:hypothetical protein
MVLSGGGVRYGWIRPFPAAATSTAPAQTTGAQRDLLREPPTPFLRSCALPLAVHGCSLRTSAQCRLRLRGTGVSRRRAVPRYGLAPLHARAEKARILANVSDHTRFKALASSARVGRWRLSVPAPALRSVNPLRRFARSRQRHQRRVCVEPHLARAKPHLGRWTDSCRRRTQPLASTRADMLPQGRSPSGPPKRRAGA